MIFATISGTTIAIVVAVLLLIALLFGRNRP
jgi:hypothetical protein